MHEKSDDHKDQAVIAISEALDYATRYAAVAPAQDNIDVWSEVVETRIEQARLKAEISQNQNKIKKMTKEIELCANGHCGPVEEKPSDIELAI